MKGLCFGKPRDLKRSSAEASHQGHPGRAQAQVGHCSDGHEAGLVQERELPAERHSALDSLIAGSSLLSSAAMVTLNEGRVFEQGL